MNVLTSRLKVNVLLRLFLAFLGITIAGLGVSITAGANLGTSPISSLPFVATFIWPLSFGVTTFILNLFFFLVQLLVYGKNFPWTQLLQIPAVAWFGFCIDIGMSCWRFFPLDTYWVQILFVLIGCCVLALGIVLELTSRAIYLPGEGVISVINLIVPRIRFGTMKILFDISQVVLALLVSFFFLERIEGVREGTLISAFMVGFFVKRFQFIGDFCKQRLLLEPIQDK